MGMKKSDVNQGFAKSLRRAFNVPEKGTSKQAELAERRERLKRERQAARGANRLRRSRTISK